MLKIIETIGLFTLIIVILAISNDKRILATTDNITSFYAYFIYVLLIVSAILSALNFYIKNKNLHLIRKYLGILLFVTGAIGFFFFPDYFYNSISVQMPYWYQATLYTLPAICVEGGIFTLFSLHLLKIKNVRKIENENAINSLFLFYAVVMVGINFFVINKVIDVSIHLLVSKIVILLLIILIIHIDKKHKQKNAVK